MIYLASTSPRRRLLLKQAGIRFRVFCPPYEEKDDPRVSVRVLVKRHALGKALSAVPRVRNGVIVGADTVVVREGSLSGKPRSMRHAEEMLGRLQGKWHTVLTAVALLRVRNGKITRKLVFAETTRIKLRKLGRAELKSYLKRIRPLDKAGAYAIQSTVRGIVERVRGSFSNAVGLPIEKLKKHIRMLR